MRLMASVAVCALFVTAVAGAEASVDCGAPAAMSDGWQVSPAAQQGLDPQLICSIGPALAKLTAADPHGVVVIRHGVLVYEQYFAGEDVRGWISLGVVPHDANTLHNIQSITKSVVALLVGIALDRAWLKDLDAPIFSFFPEYADLRTPEKDRITLRHLLSMTSGLDWPERAVSVNNPANVLRQARIAADPYRAVLERSVEAAPGSAWNYNGGGDQARPSAEPTIARADNRNPHQHLPLASDATHQEELLRSIRNPNPLRTEEIDPQHEVGLV
jgi:CubicO group peptidase (beta-lactamase class C family)